MNPDPGKESDASEREQFLRKLPLPITSITPQKKNGNRFSLFHEKTFLIGVSSQTLLNFSIQKGTIITDLLFQKISRAEEYQVVKDRCYKLLAGRDHGAEELRRKLINKGFSTDLSAQVVDEFHLKELLNDRAYAEKFAHDKFYLKRWGPRKIKSALYKKGVPKRIVTEVIRDFSDEINEKDACLELALKRRNHFLREPDERKRRQKIFRYLAGKGYSSGEIQRAISTILERLNA